MGPEESSIEPLTFDWKFDPTRTFLQEVTE